MLWNQRRSPYRTTITLSRWENRFEDLLASDGLCRHLNVLGFQRDGNPTMLLRLNDLFRRLSFIVEVVMDSQLSCIGTMIPNGNIVSLLCLSLFPHTGFITGIYGRASENKAVVLICC